MTIRVLALTGALDYVAFFGNVLLYESNEIFGAQYRAQPGHEQIFGPMVRSDLERGEKVKRDTYERILAEQLAQVREMKRAVRQADVLITPILPNVALLQTEGPAVWARGRQFNRPFSYAVLPSTSVPCGFSPGGFRIGMQFVASDLQESLLPWIAAACETATQFNLKHSPVYCAEA